MIQRDLYCTATSGDHICCRLADHDGEHRDAVTEHRW
jgi:hypothetical protein